MQVSIEAGSDIAYAHDFGLDGDEGLSIGRTLLVRGNDGHTYQAEVVRRIEAMVDHNTPGGYWFFEVHRA